MDIFVEKQPHCEATLRATVPADQVTRKLETIAREYQGVAKVPGYRPGKAPLSIVSRKYESQIAADAADALVRECVREAARQHSLAVIQVGNVKHGAAKRDAELDVSATLLLEPEFEVPDYASLDVSVPGQEVADADVQRGVERLLEQYAEFRDVEGRGLRMGDFAVLDYAASVDGAPLAEIAPTAPSSMKGGAGLWVRMAPESLWAGFCEALVGAAVDESRGVDITAPENLPLAALRGRTIHHEVTVRGIKERVLPELTDEIAQRALGRDAAGLREFVKDELEKAAAMQLDRQKRTAVLQHLLETTKFEVPRSFVQNQTQRILREIVEEEQARGASEEDIQSNREQIINAAHAGAESRVRVDFLLTRIARKENMQVTQEEIAGYVFNLAQRLGITFEKLARQLARRNAFDGIRGDIAKDKALDLLASKVKVTPAAAASQPAQA